MRARLSRIAPTSPFSAFTFPKGKPGNPKVAPAASRASRVQVRDLREVPFDVVERSRRIGVQLVHPEASHAPAERTQLMIAPMAVELAFAVRVLVPVPAVHRDIEAHAAPEQGEIEPPARNLVLRMGRKSRLI